jgi:hypothetical protein
MDNLKRVPAKVLSHLLAETREGWLFHIAAFERSFVSSDMKREGKRSRNGK